MSGHALRGRPTARRARARGWEPVGWHTPDRGMRWGWIFRRGRKWLHLHLVSDDPDVDRRAPLEEERRMEPAGGGDGRG